MTPDEFRQWRLRMGKLTISETAQILRVSFSSARQFGEGLRKVPPYISLLCSLIEQQKVMEDFAMAKPKGGKATPANIAALMATAYIQARKSKNPAMAATLNPALVQEDMHRVIQTMQAHGYDINAGQPTKTREGAATDNEAAG